MKKTLFTYLYIFVVLISSGYSQTWERAYGFRPNKEEDANTMCKLTDGNYAISGYVEGINGSIGGIIKINTNGDTLWKKTITVPNSSSSNINSSLGLEDGGFLIGGPCNLISGYNTSSNSSTYIAKSDNNGNILWIKNYYSNGIYYTIFNIIKANDGGFLAASDGYFMKIDIDGNYMWHKPATDYGVVSFYNFKAYNNNSYLVGAMTYPIVGFYILKINNTGDLLWQKQTNNYLFPEHIFPVSNKLFVLGGLLEAGTNYLIIRLQTYDTSGNFILAKSINIQKEETTDGINLYFKPNRFLISSATSYLTADTFYCHLRMLDTNLNIIRTLTIRTFGGFRGLYSAVMQDSNYIIAAGNISLHLGYGYEDFYAIKTDTSFNFQPSIGIRKIEYEIPISFNLYQNYPNPFNPNTKIKFSIPEQSIIKLEIYDVSGKLVQLLVDKKMQVGTYETDWDASSMPSGTYFCKMTNEKFTKTIKLILLK